MSRKDRPLRVVGTPTRSPRGCPPKKSDTMNIPRLALYVARVLLLCGANVLLTSCAEIPTTTPSAAPLKMQVRTTAYTHTEAGGSRNAIGTRLRFGSETDSAAADWSWMPVGTRFRLVSTGRIYVIEDYGSALIGKKTIDLYMPNESMMRQWGVRTEEIEIIEWGSRAISKMLLSRGTAGTTVKRMLVALDNKDNP